MSRNFEKSRFSHYAKCAGPCFVSHISAVNRAIRVFLQRSIDVRHVYGVTKNRGSKCENVPTTTGQNCDIVRYPSQRELSFEGPTPFQCRQTAPHVVVVAYNELLCTYTQNSDSTKPEIVCFFGQTCLDRPYILSIEVKQEALAASEPVAYRLVFPVPAIISGTGKGMNFKFCTHILSIDRNKNPL